MIKKINWLKTLAAILTIGTAGGQAGLNAQESEEERIFELSPFTVAEDNSEEYLATSTLAGTRLRTELRDLGAAISVLTPQVFEDTGATNAESILSYGLNTEISGQNGNFSNSGFSAGVADTTDSRREPHKANRVRGLAEATLTRAQFVTDIAFDDYNTSRVTINRGPNSLLFGIGSPGGVINGGLKRASLGDDFGEIQIRFGEHSSHREALDFNKVLVGDRVAIRIAALNESKNYQQKPAFDDEQRFYAAFDIVLMENENSNILGRTSFRGHVETGEKSGTPVNIIPPADGLRSWFEIPYSRSQEQFTGVTLPRWLDDGSFIPRRTVDNFAIASQFGGVVPGSAREDAFGGFTFQSNWDWVTLVYPSADSSVPNQGLSGNKSNVAGVLGRFRSVGASSADNPWVEQWSNWPLELEGSYMPGFVVPVLDPRVLDNRHVLLTGTTTSVDTDFGAHGLTLEQVFLEGKAGLEVTVDDQDYEIVDTFAIPQARWNMVWMDINEYLSNGSPNPNVGRPMMLADRLVGVPQNTNRTERESVRATGFFELDFHEHDGLIKWLGRHTFTGLFQKDQIDRTSLNTKLKWGPVQTFADLHNGNNWNSNWGPLPVWYVGPDLRNTQNYLDVSLTEPITGRLPEWGDRVQVITQRRLNPLPSSNTDGTRGEITELDVVRVPTSGNRFRQKIESQALSWQSRLLDDHLTGLVGWRTDETYSYDRAGSARLADGSWDPANQQLSDTANPTIEGNTFTYGIVAHFPEDWLFELPGGADLSFHYNESENFSPIVGRRNLQGEQLSAPTGSTQDFGFLIELMERRLSIRVNWFELTNQFAPFDTGLVNSALNTLNVYEENFREAKVLGLDFDEFINRPTHPAEADTWFSSWDDLEAAIRRVRPAYYSELINPRFEPTGSDNFVFDPIPGLSATTDFVSEGLEVDITGQITDSLRISLNIGQQKTVQNNTAREAIEAFNQTVQELMRENLWGIVWDPISADVTLESHYGRQAAIAAGIQARDGVPSQELREWRANFITNYTFRESFLKGFAIGGAVRWQDEVAIGFPTIFNEDGVQLPDLSRPINGPDQLNGDLWFSYRRMLTDKIDWKIQLNIRNAFGDDDFIPVVANPDGQIPIFRNPNPREIFLTNTFSF